MSPPRSSTIAVFRQNSKNSSTLSGSGFIFQCMRTMIILWFPLCCRHEWQVLPHSNQGLSNQTSPTAGSTTEHATSDYIHHTFPPPLPAVNRRSRSRTSRRAPCWMGSRCRPSASYSGTARTTQPRAMRTLRATRSRPPRPEWPIASGRTSSTTPSATKLPRRPDEAARSKRRDGGFGRARRLSVNPFHELIDEGHAERHAFASRALMLGELPPLTHSVHKATTTRFIVVANCHLGQVLFGPVNCGIPKTISIRLGISETQKKVSYTDMTVSRRQRHVPFMFRVKFGGCKEKRRHIVWCALTGRPQL